MEFSNTTWVQRGLISKLPGNVWGSHGAKTTIKYRDKQSTTFGVITRIRAKEKYPENYSVTFGTSNVVVHYDITFGAVIGNRDGNIDTISVVPKMLLPSITSCTHCWNPNSNHHPCKNKILNLVLILGKPHTNACNSAEEYWLNSWQYHS